MSKTSGWSKYLLIVVLIINEMGNTGDDVEGGEASKWGGHDDIDP